jgi:plasmid stabilization system protein ParE
MRVRWNKRALSQLRAAHSYIKGENPRAASEFVDATNSLAELLGQFPGMGVRTNEPGVIMFPLVRYRYLIFLQDPKRRRDSNHPHSPRVAQAAEEISG